MGGTNGRYVSDAKRLRATYPDLFKRVQAGRMSIPEAQREVADRENPGAARIRKLYEQFAPDSSDTPDEVTRKVEKLQRGLAQLQQRASERSTRFDFERRVGSKRICNECEEVRLKGAHLLYIDEDGARFFLWWCRRCLGAMPLDQWCSTWEDEQVMQHTGSEELMFISRPDFREHWSKVGPARCLDCQWKAERAKKLAAKERYCNDWAMDGMFTTLSNQNSPMYRPHWLTQGAPHYLAMDP